MSLLTFCNYDFSNYPVVILITLFGITRLPSIIPRAAEKKRGGIVSLFTCICFMTRVIFSQIPLPNPPSTPQLDVCAFFHGALTSHPGVPIFQDRNISSQKVYVPQGTKLTIIKLRQPKRSRRNFCIVICANTQNPMYV